MTPLETAAREAWLASPESRHGIWESLSQAERYSWRKIAKAAVAGYLRRIKPTEVVQLPSEMPVPPQPFRPLRADALDDNPEDESDS